MSVCAEPAAPVSEPRSGACAAPPPPLPSELRSGVAYRRARGDSWEEVATSLRYAPDALRGACAADPLFAPELEAAEAEAEREAELSALRRLKRLTESDDERVALRASEVLVRFARERRREARAAVEPAREPRAKRAEPPTEARSAGGSGGRGAKERPDAPAPARPVEAPRVRVAPEG